MVKLLSAPALLVAALALAAARPAAAQRTPRPGGAGTAGIRPGGAGRPDPRDSTRAGTPRRAAARARRWPTRCVRCP
jgi:hypothetical protein